MKYRFDPNSNKTGVINELINWTDIKDSLKDYNPEVLEVNDIITNDKYKLIVHCIITAVLKQETYVGLTLLEVL